MNIPLSQQTLYPCYDGVTPPHCHRLHRRWYRAVPFPAAAAVPHTSIRAQISIAVHQQHSLTVVSAVAFAAVNSEKHL